MNPWLRGLIETAVSGVASGIVLVIAEPEHFNLQEGFEKLFWTSIVLGLVNVANYLRQSPLPKDK